MTTEGRLRISLAGAALESRVKLIQTHQENARLLTHGMSDLIGDVAGHRQIIDCTSVQSVTLTTIEITKTTTHMQEYSSSF